MISLSAYADHIRRARLALKLEAEVEVGACMSAAERRAKGYIGVEQPGWAPLAASTIEEKVALGYPTPKPLLRDGQLRDSIKSEVETRGTEVIGLLYSADEVAEFQEYGTAKLPARPFIVPALVSTEPEIEEALGKTVVRALTPKGER